MGKIRRLGIGELELARRRLRGNADYRPGAHWRRHISSGHDAEDRAVSAGECKLLRGVWEGFGHSKRGRYNGSAAGIV